MELLEPCGTTVDPHYILTMEISVTDVDVSVVVLCLKNYLFFFFFFVGD